MHFILEKIGNKQVKKEFEMKVTSEKTNLYHQITLLICTIQAWITIHVKIADTTSELWEFEEMRTWDCSTYQ